MPPTLHKFITGLLATILLLLNASCRRTDSNPPTNVSATNQQTFAVTGVIKEFKAGRKSVTIKHGEVTNYMPAMTMPFNVKDTNELGNLQPGDEISFRLLVTEDESWIDRITKTGKATALAEATLPPTNQSPSITASHPLLDFKFTNEFGQPVSLNDFKGKAVAFTFIFTRCPIPEYCPRLSRNFVEASEKLRALPNAPTNWHFLSITFDPDFDTPEVLRAYGQIYRYDSNHWSFLTGPKDKIGELAQASGVKYEPDGANYNHNFRTLVLDAAGRLQMNFPISGDLSDYLVTEISKAAAVTNR